MNQQADNLIDHFFRHESAKLVSALTRFFGPRHIDLAEDVAQSALIEALESWRFGKIPDNPSGWLFRVAKNRALDALRHNEVRARLEPEVVRVHGENDAANRRIEEVFLDHEIEDSQLRMIFTCCDPDLPTESRIALTLKTLCGFSTPEIADALLTSEANTHKRIQRAKSRLREKQDLLDVPVGPDLVDRLETVHTVLYLLFNEGYYSTHDSELIRRNLCSEAIRLTTLICNHPTCGRPTTRALLALMSFHAARFDARVDDRGEIVLLEEQDRSLWDGAQIAQGLRLLEQASQSNEVSAYHLEAAIAAHHCTANNFHDTDWQGILNLYDLLIGLKPSPVYQLNRAIVLAKVKGPVAGIEEVEQLQDEGSLKDYHLLDATLGQLHVDAGDTASAREAFLRARSKTSSAKEHALLDRKLESLN
jgi:RNA polymerase sigma factor (sigma-70 family)